METRVHSYANREGMMSVNCRSNTFELWDGTTMSEAKQLFLNLMEESYHGEDLSEMSAEDWEHIFYSLNVEEFIKLIINEANQDSIEEIFDEKILQSMDSYLMSENDAAFIRPTQQSQEVAHIGMEFLTKHLVKEEVNVNSTEFPTIQLPMESQPPTVTNGVTDFAESCETTSKKSTSAFQSSQLDDGSTNSRVTRSSSLSKKARTLALPSKQKRVLRYSTGHKQVAKRATRSLGSSKKASTSAKPSKQKRGLKTSTGQRQVVKRAKNSLGSTKKASTSAKPSKQKRVSKTSTGQAQMAPPTTNSFGRTIKARKQKEVLETSTGERRLQEILSNPDNFQCGICEDEFATVSELTIHQRKHAGEEPHKCRICSRVFAQRMGVIVHERTHTGERPFKCSSCSKSFAHRVTLNRHIRIHTGERPHGCQYCPKSFVDQSGLNKHIFTHTGEKPFKCIDCGAGFVQKSHLQRHRRFHHRK